MLETAIIIFREGLEAFLIVAIMLAYVTNTGRATLRKPIFAGIAAAFVISATTGWHVAELAEDPVWEGTLALLAGLMVASFTVYIMKTAGTIRTNINQSLEKHAAKSGWLAVAGVFCFTILMIAREGMEIALMLGTISQQTHAGMMWAGAALGVALVGVIAYLWVTQSNKINLRLFLQVTGVFLVLFSIDLFIYGIHELGEMQALPLLGEQTQYWLHEVTEPFGHGSLYSQMITYGLLLIPLAWLGGAYIKDRFLSSRVAGAAE